MKTSPDRNLTRIYLAGLNVPSLLLFPQPIPVSGSIDTLLRHAATFVERECPLESAEQAGLRRCSTVWQQGHGSRRCLVLQVHQYLLNDHWIFNAGNDPGVASIDSAPLNINAEYPLEPLGRGYCHGWHVCRFCMSKNRSSPHDVEQGVCSSWISAASGPPPLPRFAGVTSAWSLLIGANTT